MSLRELNEDLMEGWPYREDTRNLAIVHDGEQVGAMRLNVSNDRQLVISVVTISIDPEHQRSGHGSRTMKALMKLCQRYSAILSLEAFSYPHLADGGHLCRFYEGLGMSREGEPCEQGYQHFVFGALEPTNDANMEYAL